MTKNKEVTMKTITLPEFEAQASVAPRKYTDYYKLDDLVVFIVV